MVTDDKLVRNVKLLQAINIGAKVVKMDWVKESVKHKEFVDISNKHLIIDKAFEKQYGCNLVQLYEGKKHN